MRILRPFLALSLLALVALPAAAQVSANVIAKLEAKRARNPANVGVLRSLGVALYKNKRYADAQEVLVTAQKLSPKDGVIALYLGMSAEEQGNLILAHDAYTSYLSVGKTKSAREDVGKRLSAVSQRQLQARAKEAVAQEQRLAGVVGPPSTIAVLPLRVSTTNPDLQALGRGFADLLITDLRKARALTIVERDRVQAMVDEIALGRSGAVDPAGAARSGRLLQAGKVVNGNITITGQNLQIDAAVVTTANSMVATAPASTGTLAALFDLEKRTVFAIVQGLGFTLTASERNAMNERPTQNVQAFLAYSRGLVASDAGRLDEAANFFDNARALDPNFSAAAQRANEARAGQQGAGITTVTIESKLKSGSEGQIVSAAERGGTSAVSDGIGTTLTNALSDVNPSNADAIGRPTTSASSRDASTSTTSQDQATTRTGTLTIVIKRP